MERHAESLGVEGELGMVSPASLKHHVTHSEMQALTVGPRGLDAVASPA